MERLLMGTHRITSEEEYSLQHYIDVNRPSIFSSIDAFIHCNNVFYWTPGDIKPRIKWIKKHIKKLEHG